MAPALVERPPQDLKPSNVDYKDLQAGPRTYNKIKEANAKYQNYLPTWDVTEKYPALEPFEHYDHGRDADPTFPDLLPRGVTVSDLTGNIGAEVTGIQLSKLTSAGKDQLALFVAQKKVVAFREQDFADLDIADALEFGRYFGRLHIHPTSGKPAGHSEIHLVHRGADDTTATTFFADRTTSTAWHTDVSYEAQPPGTTFLYVLEGPSAGGDTVFSNMAEAYARLSPAFQQRLHGLFVEHSAVEQAALGLERGGGVRREPVKNVHPLVRTHPVTGEKALYINQQFSRRIVGVKKEESDYLMKFLLEHVAFGQDFQVRVKWAPGTVVVWDNRVTAHSALLDWKDGQRRHVARITPQAERPYETPYEA